MNLFYFLMKNENKLKWNCKSVRVVMSRVDEIVLLNNFVLEKVV